MKYDVIVLPIIEWDHRYQRPQHLSTAFAQDGHRVYYTRLTFNGWDEASPPEPVADHVWRLALPGPPDHNRFLQPLPDDAVDACMRRFEQLAQTQDIGEAVVMVQQPFWARLAIRLRKRFGWKIVYDCMDEHDGLTALNPEILRDETLLGRNADLVVTSSLKLQAKHARHARHQLLLPNAGDYTHFSTSSGEDPLPDLTGPIIGYYGAIMEWFDVDMIAEAARLRPGWQFVLIGAVDIPAEIEQLAVLPNVHLLGEKPYADLPPYLHRFDVALIPFRLIPIIQATNPVKYYEYLSAGKPVIATPMPELVPFEHLHRTATTGAELVYQAEAALSERDRAMVQARRDWASRQTWEHRHAALREAINTLWGKATIVIVSYESLDKLRDCVESIDAHTDYPDYEVVIVDNASSREVIEFLRGFVATHPRFRLVESATNLGFSAGNNLGIQQADPASDYVVLLNNDTVVTEGWLARLLDWLRDPSIGIVGPVTWPPGVYNEAAVAVPYTGTDIEAIQAFARERALSHRGRCFDVPILAFYCVALRMRDVRAIGPLDEAFGIGMFEDDDYCMRVREAGLRVVCAENVFIHHVGRSSFGKLAQDRYDALARDNRRLYEEKWSSQWRPPAARQTIEAIVETETGELALEPLLPTVSVVLVNYDGLEHLGPCLASITSLDYPPNQIEVVVVDNASSDGSLEWLAEFWPRVRTIANRENVGFSRACNQGARVAAGEYVAFLNNDMRVDPGWLKELVAALQLDPNAGCVGSQIRDWRGRDVEFCGRYDDLFSIAYEPLPRSERPEFAGDAYSLLVSGGAMLLKRDIFLKCGGFDPRYFMYHEDVDLCWRLWTAGLRCVIAPESLVYHRGGASSGKLPSETVIGWAQKHLLWTLLKNLEEDNVRHLLPMAIYFLVERGRWSEPCMRALLAEFEATQAALGSILHSRAVIQAGRRLSDADIFARTGHPMGFIVRSPLFEQACAALLERVPADDLDLGDPANVAAHMYGWLQESLRLRAQDAGIWKHDAKRKFFRRQRARDEAAAREAEEVLEASLVQVDAWGPQHGEAGKPLNARDASALSSLWVTGTGLEDVTGVVILERLFPCSHAEGLVTCELPADATAALKQAGRYPVALQDRKGRRLPLGDIVVAANDTDSQGVR